MVLPDVCPTTDGKVEPLPTPLALFEEFIDDPATIADDIVGAEGGIPALLLLLLPGVLLGEQPSLEF